MLTFNQWVRFFKSRLTYLLSVKNHLLKWSKFVLSARWCTLQNFKARFKSLIYIRNTINWNTLFSIWKIKFKPFISKTTYTGSSFDKRISRSTISNAFCKLTNIPNPILPSPRFFLIFSVRVWTVEYFCLKIIIREEFVYSIIH